MAKDETGVLIARGKWTFWRRCDRAGVPATLAAFKAERPEMFRDATVTAEFLTTTATGTDYMVSAREPIDLAELGLTPKE